MKLKFSLNGWHSGWLSMIEKKSREILILMLFAGFAVVTNAQNIHEYGYFSDEENVGIELYDYHILYFELTPGNQLEQDSALMDCSILLSQDTIVVWGDYSASIRFRNTDKNNFIDARNGGDFAKIDSIPFVFGQLYHCWFEIDFVSLTYNLFVQTEGMDSPAQIADQFAFRNQEINELRVWSVATLESYANTLVVSAIALVEEVGEMPGSISDINVLNNNRLNVFPNPVRTSFNIEIEGDFNYELYDYSGKVVLKGSACNKCIIGENLQQGIYILNIKHNTIVFSQKLIKF
jgi:hypothetical protein